MNTKLPKLLPDENTPIGTIVKCHCINDDTGEVEELTRYFISYHCEDAIIIAARYRAADGTHYDKDRFYNYEIDIEADLQYRAFINAPKEYKWFAINQDGSGSVFQNKPEYLPAGRLSAEGSGMWCTKSSDMSMDSFRPFSICVGLFLQYKHLHKEILIERKD